MEPRAHTPTLMAPRLPQGDRTRFLTNLERIPVYFVAHQLEEHWPGLSSEDATADFLEAPKHVWMAGENAWIVRTYLELKRRGLNVKITNRLQTDRINICYAHSVLQSPESHRAFVVAVYGDRDYTDWSDLRVDQSPFLAEHRGGWLIDHWPQPGLVQRDPTRENRIERIGYLGTTENLAPAFQSSEFHRALRQLGIEFSIRSDPARWHDYHDLDLTLSVRNHPSVWLRTKPATKLFQSWIAGCPALLGQEPTYQYWGEPGMNYFEVADCATALRTLQLLKEDSALYASVRKRGTTLASRHDENAIADQWVNLLAGPIQEQYREWRNAPKSTWRRRRTHRYIQRAIAPAAWRLFRLRARWPELVHDALARRR